MIRQLFVVPLLFFLVVFAACSVWQQSGSHENNKDVLDKYIVQGNSETLASIAHKYTGSALNWKELAQLNPSLKSFRLKKGDVILVPKGYLSKKTKSSSKTYSEVKKSKSDSEIKTQNEMPFRSGNRNDEIENNREGEQVNNPRENEVSTVLIENYDNETIMFVGKGNEITRKKPEVYVPYPEGKKYKRLRDDIINEFITDEE